MNLRPIRDLSAYLHALALAEFAHGLYSWRNAGLHPRRIVSNFIWLSRERGCPPMVFWVISES